MVFHIIREIACLLLLATFIKADDPIVTVQQGQIIGKQLEFSAGDSQYSVDAYLGIPFAEPPVGKLRFKPPVAKDWQGELNAQQYGKACPQIDFPFFNITSDMKGEDCLVLNVFVPQPKPSGAAVMIFIHGGGYAFGTGSFSEDFDYHPLAALGNVIVVTINYRLNALGFLSTGDDIVPGNNGMLDQLEALKWVQKNVAAFGGDPNRVTIFGESAGAGSVSLHTLSPLSKGLFSQAIMQSGVATSSWASNYDTENFAKRAFAIGKLVGCEQQNTKQLVDCLSEVSADDLVNATQRMREVFPEDTSEIPFGPVVDGNFLPESPSSLIAKQKFNPANIMVGYNADEAMVGIYFMFPNATDKPRMNASEFEMYFAMYKNDFTLKPLHRAALELVYFDNAIMSSPDPDYLDAFVNIATDTGFACSSVAYLRDAFESNIGRVYAYYFNHHPSVSVFNKAWTGASHGDDLMFFGWHFLKNVFEPTEEEVDMTMKIIQYWSNFAKTGNPDIGSEEEEVSTEDTAWPQYTADARVYKELAPGMNNVFDPSARRCHVWNDFLPKLDAALAEAGDCKEDKKCGSHWTDEDQGACSNDERTP